MSHLKALSIEDDPYSSELLKVVLEANKYKVITAKNGEEALKILEKETPDIILVDLKLPGISGYELIKLIRSREELKKIPIVAITAFAEEEKRKEAIKAGFDGYITKPINVKTLGEEIKSFIKK